MPFGFMMLTSTGRYISGNLTEQGRFVVDGFLETGEEAFQANVAASFTFTVATDAYLTDKYTTGSFFIEQNTESLFIDKYYDRLYLDSNNTSVSLGGFLLDRLEGSINSTVESTFVFNALTGITGAIRTNQESSGSFGGTIGSTGRLILEQGTSAYFSLVSGSAGSFGVNLSTDVLFSSGIIGNVVVDAVTNVYFSGFAAVTGTILLTSDFECTLISLDNIIFDVGQEGSGTGTDIKEPDAFVMNLYSGGVSQYSNYKFDSIFFFDGIPYGCNSSGIFKLIGNADGVSGEDVEIPVAIAVAKTAISDFNTQKMKSVRDGYAYIRSTGDMLVSVTTNEQIERNNYPLYYDGVDGIHRRRVKTAQGLRGTSWQVSIKNDSGADFTIKQVDIIPVELDRSI